MCLLEVCLRSFSHDGSKSAAVPASVVHVYEV